MPYLDKAEGLSPQTGMEQQLGGDGMVELWKGDAAQYNQLKPKFNANIDYAGVHCVAKPAAVTPEKPVALPWWRRW